MFIILSLILISKSPKGISNTVESTLKAICIKEICIDGLPSLYIKEGKGITSKSRKKNTVPIRLKSKCIMLTCFAALLVPILESIVGTTAPIFCPKII